MTDFGLSDTSASVKSSKTRGSTFTVSAFGNKCGTGTVGLMAPETVVRLQRTKNSDIFCLAMTIWSAICCREPFEDITSLDEYNRKVCCPHGSRPDITMLPEDVPKMVVNLLQRAWDGNPEKRPTAGECFDELRSALMEPPPEDIFTACKKGHVEFVRILVEEFDEDPRQAYETGETPVFTACLHGNLNVAR